MKCKRLFTTCSCGGYATPNAVYVTEECKLYLECFCTKCTATCNILVPFEDLLTYYNGKPKTDEGILGENKPLSLTLTADDLKLMHDMHITEENL